jgi:hypothetical protein
MGLTKNMLALLISVRLKRDVSFESTLMVGRQNIFFSNEDLKKYLDTLNMTVQILKTS